MKKWMLSLIFIAASVAQAQPGNGAGNGGDPNELTEFTGLSAEHLESWWAVKQDLIAGFKNGRYLELPLGKLDQRKFHDDVLNALETIQVEFDSREVRVDGVKRPCENFKDADGRKHIHCNAKAYGAAMEATNASGQYKFIAHEYFAVTDYESNVNGHSTYTFSDLLSRDLSVVTVKKWAVKPAARPTPAPTAGTGALSSAVLASSEKTLFVGVFGTIQYPWQSGREFAFAETRKQVDSELRSIETQLQEKWGRFASAHGLVLTDLAFFPLENDPRATEERTFKSSGYDVNCVETKGSFDCKVGASFLVAMESRNPALWISFEKHRVRAAGYPRGQKKMERLADQLVQQDEILAASPDDCKDAGMFLGVECSVNSLTLEMR